ncbi:MAG: hypothetical protein JXB00_14330 [Bacteroidales bacterium]|nr:hypothetical protein [Bacteroidales bacterium]
MMTLKKTTAMICKKICTAAIAMFIFLPSLKAQEYTKRIEKSYRVNNSTTVDVFNKYGKIHIVTWEKDSVRFDIRLKIKATSDSRLNKLRNSIDFDFTGTEYYVIAKTRIGTNTGAIFSDLADIAGSLMPSDNKVTIDYIVMMPRHINLKLENKFGDVYIDDLDGNINLTLSNGELKANELTGNTIINLSSADAVINSVKEGKINVSYSNFHAKNADKLTVDSRSSVINIEQAGFLKIVSRRDKFYLPEISELYGESYFSDFTLHNLFKEMNFNFKYGNLSVEEISRGFSFIQIVSEYTDLDLVFARGATYDIDITHHTDVILNYPRQLANLQTKVINPDEKQNLTYGRIGSASTASKVKINAPKKCTLNIIHK